MRCPWGFTIPIGENRILDKCVFECFVGGDYFYSPSYYTYSDRSSRNTAAYCFYLYYERNTSIYNSRSKIISMQIPLNLGHQSFWPPMCAYSKNKRVQKVIVPIQVWVILPLQFFFQKYPREITDNERANQNTTVKYSLVLYDFLKN